MSVKLNIFLLLIVWNYQIPNIIGIEVNYLVSLIDSLDKIYNFETLSIFCAQHHIQPNNINSFLIELSKSVEKPKYIFTDQTDFRLDFAINKNSLSLIFTLDQTDFMLEVASGALRGIRTNKVIIIILNNASNKILLKKFFEWCWEYQFTNTIIVLKNLNGNYEIYNMNPYPTIKVQNQTNKSIENLYNETITYKKKHFFNGYIIKTPIQRDPPRVFPTYQNGKIQISGLSGKLISTFAEYYNIELKPTNPSNYNKTVNMWEIFNMIVFNEIEISIHAFSMPASRDLGRSYPLEIINMCLMVPVVSELSKSQYIILPFNISIWIAIFLFLTFLTFVIYYASWLKGKHIQFGHAFLWSLRGVLFLPSTNIQNPSRFVIFLSWIIFLFGFILYNLYLAHLTSFLSTTVYGKQLNTLSDVMSANLSIMMTQLEYQYFLKIYATKLDIDLKKLLSVTPEVFFYNRNNMNQKFSYIVPSDYWKYVNMQQQFLRHKRFRYSDICFGKFILSYPMPTDSHLDEPLTDFIMTIHQMGFYEYWSRSVFSNAFQAGLVKKYVDNIPLVQPIDMEYLEFVWYTMIIGYSIALILFIIEKFILFN